MFGFQYLPASLWVIITGISLIIVIITLGVYFWYRARTEAFNVAEKTVARLAAEKNILEAEIEQCQKWLDINREELLKLEDQRKQQLALEQELANQQTELAQKEQNVDDLRKEATDLQNVISSLIQDRSRINSDIESLESETIEWKKKRDAANEKAKTAKEFKRES